MTAAARDLGSLVVAAAMLLTLGAAALSAAVGAWVGLPAPGVLLLALLAPLGLSSALALVLVGLLCASAGALPRGACRSPEAEATETAQVSLRRRQAAADLARQDARLQDALESGAGDVELMTRALALHDARLELAKVLLVEDGDLPPSLKEELVIAHRGTSAWLRAQAR